MFVVRYDGNSEGQDRLRMHTDSSHLSFNVLLNDEFEGGGTRYVVSYSEALTHFPISCFKPDSSNIIYCRFHDRIKGETIEIQPKVGEVLLSHAMILHEGLPTTNGTRYILVGFNSIDEKDPLTNESTGLSLFSSWLNFAWMQVRFREGAERGTVHRRRTRVREDGGGAGWLSNKYVTSLFR